jgi:hypothetical protein
VLDIVGLELEVVELVVLKVVGVGELLEDDELVVLSVDGVEGLELKLLIFDEEVLELEFQPLDDEVVLVLLVVNEVDGLENDGLLEVVPGVRDR